MTRSLHRACTILLAEESAGLDRLERFYRAQKATTSSGRRCSQGAKRTGQRHRRRGVAAQPLRLCGARPLQADPPTAHLLGQVSRQAHRLGRPTRGRNNTMLSRFRITAAAAVLALGKLPAVTASAKPRLRRALRPNNRPTRCSRRSGLSAARIMWSRSTSASLGKDGTKGAWNPCQPAGPIYMMTLEFKDGAWSSLGQEMSMVGRWDVRARSAPESAEIPADWMMRAQTASARRLLGTDLADRARFPAALTIG